MVGSAAVMRVSSVMWPFSSCGTLKSTRHKNPLALHVNIANRFFIHDLFLLVFVVPINISQSFSASNAMLFRTTSAAKLKSQGNYPPSMPFGDFCAGSSNGRYSTFCFQTYFPSEGMG